MACLFCKSTTPTSAMKLFEYWSTVVWEDGSSCLMKLWVSVTCWEALTLFFGAWLLPLFPFFSFTLFTLVGDTSAASGWIYKFCGSLAKSMFCFFKIIFPYSEATGRSPYVCPVRSTRAEPGIEAEADEFPFSPLS